VIKNVSGTTFLKHVADIKLKMNILLIKTSKKTNKKTQVFDYIQITTFNCISLFYKALKLRVKA